MYYIDFAAFEKGLINITPSNISKIGFSNISKIGFCHRNDQLFWVHFQMHGLKVSQIIKLYP